MPARRTIAAAALAAAAVFLFLWLRPAAPPPLLRLTGPTMGSTYTISYHGAGAPAAAQMQGEVQAILGEVDAAVSTWRSDSALARFNAASADPAGMCMDMPRAALDLAQHALLLWHESGGAFDATLLPALQAWGFTHSNAPALPSPAPDAAQLASLRQRTGMAHLRVQGQQLCKSAPIHVEFNAIAAGYAIDRIAARFAQLGVMNHLIEVTGEIRGSGTRPGGAPWRVGIEAPLDGARQAQRIVPLSGMALSTSGSYRNWREVDGQRRGHILDARTLTPVQHRLASVTVAAPLVMHADGLSTLLMALGEEKGYTYAAERGIAALFVIPAAKGDNGDNSGDGAFTIRATPAFEKTFPPQPQKGETTP